MNCRICKKEPKGIMIENYHLDCRQKALKKLEESNKKWLNKNNK